MYTDKFIGYKQAIVDAYQKKRNDPQLDWLMRPTRYRIKQHCIQLIEHGLQKRDQPMLHNYLKMKSGNNDYLAAIKDTVADHFNGFEKFLLDTNKTTAEKNIELLAWLIDFPTRPFSQYIKEQQNELILTNQEEDVIPFHRADIEKRNISGEKKEAGALNTEELIERKIQQAATNGATVGEREKHVPQILPDKNIDRRWFIAIAVLLVTGIFIWRFLPTEKNCMYWDNDHYVATPCDVPRLDTPLVRLDHAKIRGFLRIKHVDTLTRYSVGKLWYVRVADSIEVYSAGGEHPLYPDKKLKPLTDYAVNVIQNRQKQGVRR
jgi:hypothetical protein